jgi:hypothetical protein
MSIKSKVLAAAATLTLVGGVGVTGALTAGSAAAATPSCGTSCVNTFNKDFPPTGQTGGPSSPIDVFRQSEKVGNPIILFRSSNSDPALDWTNAFQGNTSDFFQAGLVSAAVALHYGCAAGLFTSCQTVIDSDNDASSTPFSDGDEVTVGTFPDLPAFEIEYAPFGVDSGLCMGLAATASQGEGVTLQPCGVSAKTVWIQDSFDNIHALPGVPLINGSDTNFSHPFVLTYPDNANPVDRPRAQVIVTNLTGFAQPGNGGVLPVIGTVKSSQLWEQTLGVLP